MAFRNALTTEKLKKYIRGRCKNTALRDEILLESKKLIDAALYSKGLFNLPFQNQEDLAQECYIKLLTALPKFNPKIISETTGKAITAFPFFWTVICNAIRSHGKALAPRKDNVGLEEESIFEEIGNVPAPDTPERTVAQESIQSAIEDALLMVSRTNGNSVIATEIMNGRIFTDRARVLELLVKKKKKSRQQAEEIVNEAVFGARALLFQQKKSIELLHPKQFRSCRGVPELDD